MNKRTPVAGPVNPVAMPSAPLESRSNAANGNRGGASAVPPSAASKPAASVSKPLPPPPAKQSAANAKTPSQQIVDAVIVGNLPLVQKLLATDPNLIKSKDKISDELAYDLFLLAATYNHIHLLEFFNEMKKKQPDLFEETKGKRHIINYVIPLEDTLDAVQWIEAHGVDLNKVVTQETLDNAANMGSERTLNYLRSRITNPALKVPASKKILPFAKELFDAAHAGRKDLIETYMRQGADIHRASYGPGGDTPVLSAARAGKIELVRWLIEEKGIDPTTCDASGQNLVFVAASENKPELLRYCKKFPQINPNKRNGNNMGPMEGAVMFGNKEAIDCLIKEFNQDIDDLNFGSVYIALRSNHIQFVKWLLEKYPARARDEIIGVRVMFEALARGDLTVLRLCKELFPKLNMTARLDNISALGLAVRAGHEAAVKCLIEEFKMGIEENIEKSDLQAAKEAKTPEHTATFKYIMAKLREAKAADEKAAVVTPTIAVVPHATQTKDVVGTGYKTPFIPIPRGGDTIAPRAGLGQGQAPLLYNPPSPPKV